MLRPASICHMTLTCDRCGETFTAKRSDARYCSGGCRTEAYRKRNEPDRPKPRRRPLPDAMLSAEMDLHRSVERLQRLVRDDRMPRARKTLGVGPRNNILRMIRELEDVVDRLPVTDE